MKTIGLLGGMSWESTVTYYQIVNRTVKERLGGFHSAKCLLHSVDFHEIEACQSSGDWEKTGEILADAAAGLEQAGADFLLICANTMHKVTGQIEARVSIPVLHIADVTAQALKEQGVSRVALLGTKYTMQQDFYKARLHENGIEAMIPSDADMEIVNNVIYGELCKGKINPASKAEYLRIINALAGEGAQGAILGCTEIGLLVKQEDTDVPLFDTAYLHARAAALYAMEVSE